MQDRAGEQLGLAASCGQHDRALVRVGDPLDVVVWFAAGQVGWR
jgi:hypothetical protein